MKEIFTIEDTLPNKISYYHMLAFLATLPFDRFYSELVLISLVVHELIHLTKEKVLSIRIPVMLPALVFFLTLAGTTYSTWKTQAWGEVEKQLALVLLPFLFSVTSLNIEKYSMRLMKGFAITCIVTIVYLYVDALLIIRNNGLPLSSVLTKSFINHNFSLPISLHATYFSMYITLSATVLLYLTIHSRKATVRFLYFIGLAILMAAIIQLASRAVIIASLIIVNIIFPFLLLEKARRLKFILITSLLSILGIVALTRIESFQDRYVLALKEDLAKPTINNNDLEPRLARWESAWKLAKESIIFGHGSGTEIKLLKERYFQDRLYNSYLLELNAHNQYLSFLVKTGIVGLVVYIYLLYAGCRTAIEKRDVVFCSFITITLIVSFSENILDVNKGIFFLSYFYSFFMKKYLVVDKPFPVLPQSSGHI